MWRKKQYVTVKSHYHDYIQGTYLIKTRGLVVIAKKENYLITENYEILIKLAKDNKLDLRESNFELNQHGDFTGIVKFTNREPIFISGHTIDISNKNQVVKQYNDNPAIKIVTRRVRSKVGAKIIKTPITLTFDIAKTAGVVAVSPLAIPLLIMFAPPPF